MKTSYERSLKLHQNKNKKTSTYEIETTLVLSTGHISERDNKNLNAQSKNGGMSYPNLILYKYEYGHLINITPDMKEEIKDFKNEFSEGFIQSLELGIKLGVNWVKFDCDGDLLNELPNYDWDEN